MYKGKTILAVIPARGGSKGLPRKNILPLAGKPLIAWTIEAALQSGVIDKLLVSTDDAEIAGIAKSLGVDIPFIRPEELASDKAKGIDVIIHASDWLAERGDHYDLVLALQPTSPLRSSEDIIKSVELFIQKQAGAIVSVCEAEHSPLWTGTIGADLCMKEFMLPVVKNQNRQSLERYYRLNGAIYLIDALYLREIYGFIGERTYAYVMPRERSVDIDTELDFKFAEFLLNRNIN